LTCVRTALTDVELDAERLGGVDGAHAYVPVLSRTDQTWLGAPSGMFKLCCWAWSQTGQMRLFMPVAQR
jgi:hypothetical protein